MYAELEKSIRSAFPDFNVVPKSTSRLMRICNCLLKVLTFGRYKEFMDSMTTTVGFTIYTPTGWDEWPEMKKAMILRHEAVHMRQAKKYSRPLYYFLYLFFPVPCVWAYFRMKFEMEAYTESIKAYAEYRGTRALLADKEMESRYIEIFTSYKYLWMWPWKGRISEWFNDVKYTLLCGKI